MIFLAFLSEREKAQLAGARREEWSEPLYIHVAKINQIPNGSANIKILFITSRRRSVFHNTFHHRAWFEDEKTRTNSIWCSHAQFCKIKSDENDIASANRRLWQINWEIIEKCSRIFMKDFPELFPTKENKLSHRTLSWLPNNSTTMKWFLKFVSNKKIGFFFFQKKGKFTFPFSLFPSVPWISTTFLDCTFCHCLYTYAVEVVSVAKGFAR